MRTIGWATGIFLALATPSWPKPNEASELLAKADGFRAGFDSFVTRVRITSFTGSKETETAEFEASIKGDNSYIRFLSPRSKGQALIMRGDDMWLLLPAVARPMRITPIQRLLGNASNGDIARLRYSADYEPTMAGEETVDGEACAVLELRARRKGATYQRIRYTLRRSDGRPMRAELYLTSGKPMKTVSYGEPKPMAGRLMLTRVEIRGASPRRASDVSAERTVDNERGGASPRRADDVSAERTVDNERGGASPRRADDIAEAESWSVVETLDLAPRSLPDKLFHPARAEGQP